MREEAQDHLHNNNNIRSRLSRTEAGDLGAMQLSHCLPDVVGHKIITSYHLTPVTQSTEEIKLHWLIPKADIQCINQIGAARKGHPSPN